MVHKSHRVDHESTHDKNREKINCPVKDCVKTFTKYNNWKRNFEKHHVGLELLDYVYDSDESEKDLNESVKTLSSDVRTLKKTIAMVDNVKLPSKKVGPKMVRIEIERKF